jgi:hypothetical protein
LHVTPQAPQFVRLEVRSTQAPPHEVSEPVPASAPPSADIEQLFLHAPWSQTSPAGHFVPHAPQFAGSDV